MGSSCLGPHLGSCSPLFYRSRLQAIEHFACQLPALRGNLEGRLSLEDPPAGLPGLRHRHRMADPVLEFATQTGLLNSRLDPAEDLHREPRLLVYTGEHDSQQFEVRDRLQGDTHWGLVSQRDLVAALVAVGRHAQDACRAAVGIQIDDGDRIPSVLADLKAYAGRPKAIELVALRAPRDPFRRTNPET